MILLHRIQLMAIALLLVFSSVEAVDTDQGRVDSLKLILRNSAEGETIDIMNQLSDAHAYSDWDKSQRYANLALDLAISQQDRYGQGVAYLHLARYYNETTDYRSALDYAELAVGQFEFLTDDWQIARTLRTIGNTYSLLNQSDQSLDYYLRALMIFEDIENKPEVAVTVTVIGDVYAQWGQTNKALRFFERALSIYQERHHIKGILASENRLAQALLVLRQYDTAERHLTAALNVSDQSDYPQLLANLYTSLGELYYNQYQLNTAQKYFLRALDLKRQGDDQGEIALALSDVARVYEEAGEVDKALSYLSQALAVVAGTSHKVISAEIRLQLGKLYMEAGNRSLALKSLLTGLEIALIADDLGSMQKAHELLTEAYSRFDQPHKALTHQKALQELRDQLNVQQSNRRVAELEVRYELDKRVKELNYLKESALIKDMEFERRYTIMWLMMGFVALILIMILVFVYYRARLIRQVEQEKMEQALKLKADFTAMLVHDLRSPLTSVYGFAELLKMGEKPFERIKEIAVTIRETSQKMLHLVNEMLDLSKFEAGKMVLSKSQVALKPIIRSSIQMLDPVANQQKTTVTLDAADGLSLCFCDAGKVEQVITNFINNALHHTPEGAEVIVHLHEHRQKGESFMYFSVEDDGPGVDPDQQDRIFDKYAQLESRNKGQKSGTGLGLAVSQMIIEQHGGVVGYQDRQPNGSIFYFQLPCEDTASTREETSEK